MIAYYCEYHGYLCDAPQGAEVICFCSNKATTTAKEVS